MTENHPLIAYLATLGAIVVLTIAAVAICMRFTGSEEQLAKVIAALAFIGATTTGLIGVIGTFRPKAPTTPESSTGDQK
ncbi:hypothetical protein JMG10_34285 [Nostoc ellipsosporum NOK]|nr:hypothetical protein [Nostoc ellipsosporum NOK]